MAIEFVGSATATGSNGANLAVALNSLTGGIDTAVRQGDFIMLFGAVPSNTAAIDWSGYTSADEGNNSANTARGAISYGFAGASPPTSATFTADALATSSVGVLAMVFRGVNTSTPLDIAVATATGSSTNPDPPVTGSNMTTNECVAVAFAFSLVNDAAITVPTGYAGLTQANAGADTNDVSLAAAYLGGRGQGQTEDPPAFTGWSTGSWRAVTVILRPATTKIRLVGSISGGALDGSDVTLDLTAITGGIGSAAAEDDLVIIIGGFPRAGTVGPSTAGYTGIVDQGTTAHQYVGYKFMGSTPDTSVTCRGSGNVADGVAYSAIVLRGVDKNQPIDVTTTLATGNSATPNPASITPTSADTMILALVHSGTNSAAPARPQHFCRMIFATADDTSDACTGASIRTLRVAAAIDPPTFTNYTSGAWSAATVALRPRQLNIACAPSSIAITPTAAVLKTTMVAAPSSVAITGRPATFRKAKIIAAAPSSVAITSIAAGLRASRKIAAAPSAITITGIAAAMKATRRITASPSSISLTARAAGLRASHKIAAAPSSITISPVDATLTKTGGTIGILAEPSSIVITPISATLRATMLAAPASIVITAQPAGLRTARRLAAQPSSVTLSPVDAFLRAQRELDAQPSTVVITPSDASLTVGTPPAAPADSGHDGRILQPGGLLTRR